jgi:hypothetical protein
MLLLLWYLPLILFSGACETFESRRRAGSSAGRATSGNLTRERLSRERALLRKERLDMKTPSTIAIVATFAAFVPATLYAQSPPPAQLAPGSSGAVIAPQGQAPSSPPRSSIPDAAPGGNTVQAPLATTPPVTTGEGSPAPGSRRGASAATRK